MTTFAFLSPSRHNRNYSSDLNERVICDGHFYEGGIGMKRVVLLAAVAVFSVLGLVTAEFA
ncbi:MAG TPA: hypothetical protein VFM24_08680, partial [Nitrospira sp.]|nr:hypothetical protein [Nitrospira sp.]